MSQAKTSDARPAETARPLWPVWARGLASVLIVWQVCAVLIGPLSLGAPGLPPPVLAAFARPLFEPYIKATYLDHGYKFFAPDPGPSHLVLYDILRDDGTHVRGQLPDRQEHWPRLMYHRHFMLSEFVGNGPPDPDWFQTPSDWKSRKLSAWEQGLAKAYAHHLIAEPGAMQVTLTLRQHMLPAPETIQGGRTLEDPESYVDRPLGTFTRDAL